MRDFNRNNNRSGGGRFGGDSRRRDFGGRDSGRREMHSAVCDECGKNCEVPFRPSGDKPIYCSDCFEKKNGRGSGRSSQRGSGGAEYGNRDNTNKQLLDQASSLNAKLDRIIRLLEPDNEIKQAPEELVANKTVKKPTSKKSKAKTKRVSKKKAKKSTSKGK